jgi:hypothetical protein
MSACVAGLMPVSIRSWLETLRDQMGDMRDGTAATRD